MATGDTKLSICSDALIMLGASPLSSFSEGTDAAQICDRLYDDTRDTLLQMYPWSFTYKKSQLARTTNTPVNEYRYEFTLPSDRLGSGVRAIYNSNSVGAQSINTGWEVFGSSVFSNETTLYADYQFRPSEDVLPTYFIQLLKYWMTWHIAEAVTDQLTKAEYYKQVAAGLPSENMRGGMFRQCTQIDSQTRPSWQIDDFDLTAVR